MTESKHFLISGRVQGVSYRANASKQAQSLALRGWVRNLSDGRVEALATGPTPAMENFERWLGQGPEHASVSSVEARPAHFEELEELKGLDDFQIR